MHSMGSISALRTSIEAPSTEIRWLGTMSVIWSSQKAVRPVSTRPLWGMGWSSTTSKAEIRSDVTISRRSSPAS
jgi:hypothetical protein